MQPRACAAEPRRRRAEDAELGDLTPEPALQLLDASETSIDRIEVAKDLSESLVHVLMQRVEALVDPGELAAEEFDKLLVLAGSHNPSFLSHLGDEFKCL